MQDLISIIVPVYNAEQHLSKMIETVLSQTYQKWELILVNDGSIDNTDFIIKKYLQKDSRIRYFTQINSGPSAARNKGIAEAAGVYLSFIDADDWVSPHYLAKLIEPLVDSKVDLVCAGYYEINNQYKEGLKLHDFKLEQHNHEINKYEFLSNIFNGVTGVLWAKLFKKEIFFINSIRLHLDLRLSEDLIAVLEYAMHIQTVYIVGDSIYYYNRLEQGNLSGRFKLSNYEDLQILKKEIEKYRNELLFLDLDDILKKRTYSFMIKLLRDHITSKEDFYAIADFLVKNESPFVTNCKHNDKINNRVLNWVFHGNYCGSLIVLRLYEMVRRFKNG